MTKLSEGLARVASLARPTIWDTPTADRRLDLASELAILIALDAGPHATNPANMRRPGCG